MTKLEKIYLKEGYIKPRTIMISRSRETEKLYNLEDKTHTFMRECAKEWSKYLGINKGMYWKQAIPQILYDLLDSWDHKGAYLAARAYVEREEVRRKKINV